MWGILKLKINIRRIKKFKISITNIFWKNFCTLIIFFDFDFWIFKILLNYLPIWLKKSINKISKNLIKMYDTISIFK